MGKLLFILFFATLVILVASGQPKKDYYGSWYAMDMNGQKSNVRFDETSYSIQDINGRTTKFQYEQLSEQSYEGKSFIIQLSDDRIYYITFPITGDNSRGLISTDYGELTRSICRLDYVQPQSIYRWPD